MKKVLIIGAGIAGRDVLKEILASPDMELRVIGFIDEDISKVGQIINGFKVLGFGKDLKKIISGEKIEEVIIAIPSAEGRSITRYVKICTEARVGFRVVPRVKEIIEGRAKLEFVRKVRVEDLLGRPVVKADVKTLKDFFRNKKILITGAAGSIGSELTRQIAAYKPAELILLDWWENGIFTLEYEIRSLYPKNNFSFIIANIQDYLKINSIFQKYKPDYVFHAAAYKHVPLMEEFPEEAVKNNVLGSFNLAQIALKNEVDKFIIISTDKAANPVNVMGATKLIAEGIGQMLNSVKTNFISVRFGNVLDSYGSVVQIFRKQIEEGGPITITDKRMTRYFMTIPEAVNLILKAAFLGKGGELFVLDMGKPIKIVHLAELMIRLSGYIPGKDIKIVYSGKRKGEKINETLFNKHEKLTYTKEGKIFVSRNIEFDKEKLLHFIQKMKEIIDTSKINLVRREINSLIPSFPPNAK